jgi:hypothetical protein
MTRTQKSKIKHCLWSILNETDPDHNKVHQELEAIAIYLLDYTKQP